MSRPQPTRQPSLLPAFEPVSSSPPRVNPQKRKYGSIAASTQKYPTPVPSSSTAIASSSPSRRPNLHRTTSTCSERAPLSSLETVRVPVNGEPVLLGRSSASSQYQLPYNRHISRVHVSAKYVPRSDTNASPQLLIDCLGWNGCKVHNGGRVRDLAKGETFVSKEPSSEIILDVQDTRVFIAWPALDSTDAFGSTDGLWSRASTPDDVLPINRAAPMFRSSPPPMHPQSPVSPSPARHILTHPSVTSYGDENIPPVEKPAVLVYEDPDSDHPHEADLGSPSVSMRTTFHQSFKAEHIAAGISSESLSSSVPEGLGEQGNENEENDPIIHSFGPFGSNILSRLHSFSANDSLRSPDQCSKRRKISDDAYESTNHQPSAINRPNALAAPPPRLHVSPIKNHVINQLAFSRVHAIPLSTIHGNLPADLKTANTTTPNDDEVLSYADLNQILEDVPCIGEIRREGKDAAGKPLENEYYYMPENDDNVMRRDAVLGGIGGTGLRAVRKNHKQYFWKRPRH